MANQSVSEAEKQLRSENGELLQRLTEAEETLYAIRNGEVDAIVVSGAEGTRIFSLTSAETPYRIMVEEMHEGAATLMADTTIIYCNSRFAELVARPAEQIIGASFSQFIGENEKPAFTRLFNVGTAEKSSGEITFLSPENEVRYFNLSFSPLPPEVTGDVCMIVSDFTERKQAEELRISEEKYKAIFEQSGVGKSITSVADGKMKVNKAFCELLGYSEAELSELNWKTITPNDSLEQDQKIADSLISGEKASARWEKRYIHKNGNVIWVDISTTVQRDKENNPLFFNTSIIDITKRKQAQEELRQSEERYRILLESLEAGIVVHAPDTSIIMNNRRATELLGLSEEQMKGRLAIDPEWKFIHEDGLTLRLEEYPVSRIIASGEPFSNMILGVVQPTGSAQVWLTVNGIPDFDERGKISEIIISFIEITERIQAEQKLIEINKDLYFQNEESTRRATELSLKNLKLQEQDVQYRNLANSGPALIWTSGTDKLCNYFNTTWLTFTGRTLEQEIGNGWAEGVHPADFDSCLETYLTAFDQQKPFEMEYRLMHSSGAYKWILDLGTPNYNMSGEFIGYIGNCFDISKRKQIEEDLLVAEWKFRALFDNGPIGVAYHELIYDCAGNPIDYRFIDVNSQYIELTGVDPRGKTVKQVFPDIGNDPFDWIGTYAQVVRTGKSLNFEQYFMPIDRWYNCVAFPYRPDQFVVAFFEITKRKQAEADLQKKMDELLLFQRLTVGRELKMIELKKEVNELLKSSGKDERYRIVE